MEKKFYAEFQYTMQAYFNGRMFDSKPNDVGSIPTACANVLVGQLAESIGLNPIQCGFDSHRGHKNGLEAR